MHRVFVAVARGSRVAVPPRRSTVLDPARIVTFAAAVPCSTHKTGAVLMRLASLLSVGLLAAACAPKSETEAASAAASAPAPLSEAALDSVKAVDAAFAAGMNAKDTAAVFAIYAADAKVMPPDSPMLEGSDGHAAIT